MDYLNVTAIYYDYYARTSETPVVFKSDVSKVVIMAILGVLAVLGNLFVCISSYIHKRKYNEEDYPDLKPAWVSVAVANVLLGFFGLI